MTSALEAWLTRWGLVPDGNLIVGPYTGNLLQPVRKGDVVAMLKVAAATAYDDEQRGIDVLEWYAGNGATRVLARDGEAVLLERAQGRRDLAAMARDGHDDAATSILCDVASNLHAPRTGRVPSTLVPLSVWFQQLEPAASQHGGIFADALVAARALLIEPVDEVVLHGDLHHDNVLDGEARGWLAIDPKGLIGDRAFEFATVLSNPDAATALREGRIPRQIAVVTAHTSIAPKRLSRWLLAYAGLAAAGCIRDGFDAAPALAIAAIAKAALK